MQRIINSLIITVSSLLLFSVATPALAYAATSPEDPAKAQVCEGIGEAGDNCDDSTGFQTLITDVVNTLSVIVGIVAVVMIIVAGLRYVTSGGESGRVSSAKSALIYAFVGLAIVALAQVLVHIVYGAAVSGKT